MTATSLPSDRKALRVWLRDQEDELAALCRRKLRDIVSAALERYVGTMTASALTASGDPSTLDDIPGAWLSVVYDDIAPKVEEVYLAGNVAAWVGLPTEPTEATARAFERVTNQNAVSYMTDATNRLAGVGDKTWDMVKGKTTAAIAAGMSTEQLKTEIENITRFSEYRADTIARTETNGAYVQGDMAGARALGNVGPVEKTWRATEDARTREDHTDADGQTVLINDTFKVGGEDMDAPLDPTASPGNVVNCRCYVEFLYPGDDRPDGSTVEALETDTLAATSVSVAEPDTSTIAGQLNPRTPAYANIDAAADKFGVSRAQVASFMKDGPTVAAAVRAEAASSALESFEFLDRFEGLQIARPPAGVKSGEYDFLERLSPKERSRLSSGGWYSDNRDSHAIDVLFDEAVRVGAMSADASLDEFVDTWLEHTRVIDASKSLRSGRWPDGARFGNFDPTKLAPVHAEQGIDIRQIIGKDKWDQAGYLASKASDQAAEDAYRVLGADRITGGDAPWRMSFDTWRTEVDQLEYNLANGVDAAASGRRLGELIPFDLDSGQDYEDLYAEIVETAKLAQVDVASWASIPWRTG